MAAGLADWYFMAVREAVARKTVWHASVMNGQFLQVIPVLIEPVIEKCFEIFLLNHRICIH
jgi:hypothetical protein